MTPLDTLVSKVGIEGQFVDARGETQRASFETKRHLLAAMGVEIANEADAAAALAAMEREEWESPLPPVAVRYVDCGPAVIDLTLPADTDAVIWQLDLEDGSSESGRIGFGDLLPVGERKSDRGSLQRRRLALRHGLPWGYHHFRIEGHPGESLLVVTPGRCWLPPAAVEGRSVWGVAAQLYLLRSAHNWGIGDFGDLRRLTETLSAAGADVIGVNPLHALFLEKPEYASPYSPASRLLLNVLYIDITSLPELGACPNAQGLLDDPSFWRRLDACRSPSHVQYARIAELKLQVLRLVYDSCKCSPDGTAWQEFEAFRRERGQSFEQACLFQALCRHLAEADKEEDWHKWPEGYRSPASPDTTAFGDEHRDLVAFFAWMQWVADRQLRDAAAAGGQMEVGLYRDLAVGADPRGAETWSNPFAVVRGVHIGAPPDSYNAAGQDWGLPPLHPHALRKEKYRSFIELLRANMRHAGGLRIDHVMGLQHLYWVPAGRPPQEGAYVRYPMEDLVGILALESQRHRCLVVGEDLGTVHPDFRDRMAKAAILSYRVLIFEQDSSTGEFTTPAAYPRLSVAVAGNHDLPTIRAWWEGLDIDLKERLDQYSTAAQAEAARVQRRRDCEELLSALVYEGLLPESDPLEIEAIAIAVHKFLARSNAFLVMAQLDDISWESEPVNVPGTCEEYPNWRRAHSPAPIPN